MNKCDIKFIIFVIIVTLFFHCHTKRLYTFRNITVHIRVSNTTQQLQKIFVSQAKNSNEFLRKVVGRIRTVSIEKQEIPILLKNSISDVSRLKRIRISSCGVEELEPGFLKNVTRIFEFDLSYNLIRDIKYNVFNNKKINRLYLNNNKIYDIHKEAFANMTNLEMIQLNNNRLRIWDSSWFFHTPVRHVDFSSNMIEELPSGAFDYFKEFRKQCYDEFYYINFNNNVLLKINQNSLPEVSSLLFLFLENNLIENIEDGCFNGIQKMEALKLGRNYLQIFENRLLGDMDVRYLKLNDNYIRNIDVNITEILNIEGNPLDTECMKRWDERKKRDANLFQRYFYDS